MEKNIVETLVWAGAICDAIIALLMLATRLKSPTKLINDKMGAYEKTFSELNAKMSVLEHERQSQKKTMAILSSSLLAIVKHIRTGDGEEYLHKAEDDLIQHITKI